jgi:hypothetical protein
MNVPLPPASDVSVPESMTKTPLAEPEVSEGNGSSSEKPAKLAEFAAPGRPLKLILTLMSKELSMETVPKPEPSMGFAPVKDPVRINPACAGIALRISMPLRTAKEKEMRHIGTIYLTLILVVR